MNESKKEKKKVKTRFKVGMGVSCEPQTLAQTTNERRTLMMWKVRKKEEFEFVVQSKTKDEQLEFVSVDVTFNYPQRAYILDFRILR